MLDAIPPSLRTTIQADLDEGRPLRATPEVPDADMPQYLEIVSRLVTDERMAETYRKLFPARPGEFRTSSATAAPPREADEAIKHQRQSPLKETKQTALFDFLHMVALKCCQISHIRLMHDSDYRAHLRNVSKTLDRAAHKIDHAAATLYACLATLEEHQMLLDKDMLALVARITRKASLRAQRPPVHETETPAGQRPTTELAHDLRSMADAFRISATGKPVYAWRESLPMSIPRKLALERNSELLFRREAVRWFHRYIHKNRISATLHIDAEIVASVVETALDIPPDDNQLTADAILAEAREIYDENRGQYRIPRIRLQQKKKRIPPSLLCRFPQEPS